MKAYPDNIKEISFLATLDRSSPYRPWFAALGATAYWGDRPVRHATARAARRRADQGRGAGDRHVSTARGGIEYHDAYLVDNDSRFVFSFVRSAIEAGAAAANYVELVSAERVADRWVAGCATSTTATSSRRRPV